MDYQQKNAQILAEWLTKHPSVQKVFYPGLDPVKMSHAAIPKGERERLGITDNLIRVSVGLEEIKDLLEDFDQALVRCNS
jgi:cystathionine beta-lyase/cystathionine gamma-synthase